MASDFKIPFLGKLPLDPRIGELHVHCTCIYWTVFVEMLIIIITLQYMYILCFGA